MLWWLFLASSVISLCFGDIYFHNPRGSNNRLNENSANRRNGNRLFDSQNNNRGGYNVGDDKSTESASQDDQYSMKYFYSSAHPTGTSELSFEWTNQHGCGGNERTDPTKQNCNHVLQFMCEKDVATPAGGLDNFRNGQSTDTQKYTSGRSDETLTDFNTRKADSVDLNKGLHEPFTWYDMCSTRPRNKGLFIADQNLRGQSSKYTRQNPNGNRRGYECPEERDYYPYWHPTPWKDIAVLTNNVTLCQNLYLKESFNTHSRWECIEFYDQNQNQRRYKSIYNNRVDCQNNKGVWTEISNYLEFAPKFKSQTQCEKAKYLWAVPFDSPTPNKKQCLVPLLPVKCEQAMWSRSNHLGYSRQGKTTGYTWTLPHFPSLENKRCIVRIRYNISTDDYDPFGTTSSENANRSPVKNNPLVDVGLEGVNLRLAINTAQHGRVFQDRSHVMLLRPRPSEVSSSARLFNLNIKGKRGSTVQVYPGVPYDFVPNDLKLTLSDLVHVQWTGSNTHHNGAPGGDGQTGSDGKGRDGSDRHNLVEILKLTDSFPAVWEANKLWSSLKVVWSYSKQTTIKDYVISLATSGYYSCEKNKNCGGESVESKAAMDGLLDNASPSYQGLIMQFVKPGTFYYMSTRNNDMGIRSQKGRFTVTN